MLKKFRSVLCVMISVLFVGATLAGCALFKKDVKYDQAQIVGSFHAHGHKIEINKRQLMDAYNNWGYQYVTQQGLSLGEAYDKTLEQLIDREIMIIESKRLFGDLSNYEKELARTTTYDYIERSFRSVENEVRSNSATGASVEETPTEEEVTPAPTYTAYEKYIEKNYGEYELYLEKYREDATVLTDHKYDNNHTAFIDFLLMPRGESKQEQSITTASFNKFVRYLQNIEKGIAYEWNGTEWTFRNVSYNDNNRRDVIIREIRRIQHEEERGLIIKRLEEAHKLGITTPADYTALQDLRRTNFDEVGGFTDTIQNINRQFVNKAVHDAKQLFRADVERAIDNVDKGHTSRNDIGGQLLDNLKSTLYAPYEIAQDYFTVSHILLEYSEAQKAEIEELEAKAKVGEITQGALKQEKVRIQGQVTTTKRENGVATGSPMSANDVLAHINSYINKSGTVSKQELFRDMIYMFNTDPGMQNPEFEYVIGIEKRTEQQIKDKVQDTMSRMVPEFTQSSRELYATGNKGALSGLVWTDYGAHIIMYTRNVTDFIYTPNEQSRWTQLDQLDNIIHMTQTSYGNKTFFDTAIERVTKPSYDVFQYNLVADFKAGKTITLNKSKYKNLTK